MTVYRVTKGQDAWVVYEAIIEAETPDQANEFAWADKRADIWQPTGDVREFDEVQIFEDETEEVPADTVVEENQTINVTPAQRDMILAALLLWLDVVNDGGEYINEQLVEIATNGDQHAMMDDVEIDKLCEAINGGE